MNRYVYFQLELSNAAKIFFQDRRFDLQLMLVADVLVMATAALRKVRTIWFYSVGRSLQNCFRLASGKTSLLFEQQSFDSFAFDDKGYEDSLAGPVVIRRQPGQAVAAVYKFFDGELQAKILCY